MKTVIRFSPFGGSGAPCTLLDVPLTMAYAECLRTTALGHRLLTALAVILSLALSVPASADKTTLARWREAGT